MSHTRRFASIATLLAIGMSTLVLAPTALARQASPAAPAAPAAPASPAAPAAPVEPFTRDTLETIRAQYDVPGLVAICVTPDKVEFLEACGVRKKGENIALEKSDRIHLGSCTKAFTSTLAATLVADGKLRWDSTVGEVLGGVEPKMAEGWKHITLEQLFRHRGGAPAKAPTEAWQRAWTCADPVAQCREAFVNALLTAPPQSAPGPFVYSNQGYVIAGRMCEVAGGKPYEELLTERVLKPLGIEHAGFGSPTKAVPSSPWGHTAEGQPTDVDNPQAIAPAGTLHMPMEDWGKFVQFHLGGKPPAGLEGAARHLAVLQAGSNQQPGESLGWLVVTRRWGGTVLTHAGSNNAWYTVAWLAPEKGFAVLVGCNQGGPAANKACDIASQRMIRSRLGIPEPTTQPAVAPGGSPAR
jgi:CubicO group peptidase (beta-lactamase class C family)